MVISFQKLFIKLYKFVHYFSTFTFYNNSQGLADNTVVAKVNGEVWDLDRPFEGDATLHLLKFDDPEGDES